LVGDPLLGDLLLIFAQQLACDHGLDRDSSAVEPTRKAPHETWLAGSVMRLSRFKID
jgi:hypothetical protein